MQSAWIEAILGGILIGISATLLLIFNGRICGISGIFFGCLQPKKMSEWSWRVLFMSGLLLGGFIWGLSYKDAFINLSERPLYLTVIAGIAVGLGTRLANGCTSGHGVCGISRLSLRSVLATLVFILAGSLSVAFMHLWLADL